MSAGWRIDLKLQLDDWPKTETLGRAVVIRDFKGIDTFNVPGFWA